MTWLDIPQIAHVWEHNGGSKANVVVMTAVCLAESGGHVEAISPTSDYGLWQINASNFGWLHLTRSAALRENPNARAAITMSGGGTNVAPWCTCWRDPARDCGHGSLHVPQAGSPAHAEIPKVLAALGGSAGGGGGGGGGGGAGAGLHRTRVEWDHLKYMLGPYAADRWKRIRNAGDQARKLGG